MRRGSMTSVESSTVRIQRGHRILEDHGDPFAGRTLRSSGSGMVRRSTPPNKACPPSIRPAVWESAPTRRDKPPISRAGLSHDPDGLPALQFEGNAVDRADNAVPGVERGPEVANVENRCGRGGNVGRGKAGRKDRTVNAWHGQPAWLFRDRNKDLCAITGKESGRRLLEL